MSNGFSEVNIEISGRCNARCPYCVKGIKNREKGEMDHVMDLSMFKEILNHLYRYEIISSDASVGLYSWGEPFLNNQINDICSFMCENGQKFHLSTNASVYNQGLAEHLKFCRTIIISMPGFSQSSYDRIHGFQFEVIKRNVEHMVLHYRESGFRGSFVIAFHIYQFNEDEIEKAYEFAKSLKISIVFSCAFLNGFSLARNYLNNDLSYEELKQMGRDVNLGYVDKLLSTRPEKEECLEMNRLVIDEYGEVVQCCNVDPQTLNYSLGKVTEFTSKKEIDARRQELLESQECTWCMESGVHYWTHHPFTPAWVDSMIENRKRSS